jgi:hypothetical protein
MGVQVPQTLFEHPMSTIEKAQFTASSLVVGDVEGNVMDI